MRCERNCSCHSVGFGLSNCFLYSLDYNEASLDNLQSNHKHFKLYFSNQPKFTKPFGASTIDLNYSREYFPMVDCNGVPWRKVCGKCSQWEKRKFYQDPNGLIIYGRKRTCESEAELKSVRNFFVWERNLAYDGGSTYHMT